jgi:hypothetical protein
VPGRALRVRGQVLLARLQRQTPALVTRAVRRAGPSCPGNRVRSSLTAWPCIRIRGRSTASLVDVYK